jgi:hypothetical protein
MLANGKMDVCYNVQTAVDAKHKLIAAFEGNGKNHLTPMAVAAGAHMEAEGMECCGGPGGTAACRILWPAWRRSSRLLSMQGEREGERRVCADVSLAYNMKRAINILGAGNLLKAFA